MARLRVQSIIQLTSDTILEQFDDFINIAFSSLVGQFFTFLNK